MIPKILCFLFGHILREKVTTNIKGSGFDQTYYWHWQYLNMCPRCGKRLFPLTQGEGEIK